MRVALMAVRASAAADPPVKNALVWHWYYSAKHEQVARRVGQAFLPVKNGKAGQAFLPVTIRRTRMSAPLEIQPPCPGAQGGNMNPTDDAYFRDYHRMQV